MEWQNEAHNSIRILLDHVVQRIIGEPVPELMESIMKILNKEVGPSYLWPGNVLVDKIARKKVVEPTIHKDFLSA